MEENVRAHLEDFSKRPACGVSTQQIGTVRSSLCGISRR